MNYNSTDISSVLDNQNDISQSNQENDSDFTTKYSSMLQNMDNLFGDTILHQLTKPVSNKKEHCDTKYDAEYEKLVDHSDDVEEYYHDCDDNTWEVFNKLLDSQLILCKSFIKLINKK
jgi:hypothetical protein